MMTSRLPGFYKLTVTERLEKIAEICKLDENEQSLILKTGGLSLDLANRMIENVIGTFELPIGIATNFLIDGKDYLIPMVIEEPSVVAAASNGAKMARFKGGFETNVTDPIMIGQIHLKVENPESAKFEILRNKDEIIRNANDIDSTIIKLGGGCKDLKVRVLETERGKVLTVHLLIDVRDAMGANFVNTVCEKVAPLIEKLTGGKAILRILSNLCVYRMAYAKAVFDKDKIGGEEVVDKILDAYAIAKADPFRCATHNKGIMNGVCAVAMATGNDYRALEAAAHFYSAINGYKPLTRYERTNNGDLIGVIELPVSVGSVGGTISANPLARICLKILGVKTSSELSRILAAVGLAQNFAALRALVTEGIQKGHMRLHAKTIAIMAGAKDDEIDIVANEMVKSGKIRLEFAKEIIKKIRGV